MRRSPVHLCIVAFLCSVSLSGCTFMSAAGPSASRVNGADGKALADANIKVIDLTDDVARDLVASSRAPTFSESLGDGTPVGTIIGRGDVLDIAIWEAPPAALFGSSIGGGGDLMGAGQMSRSTSLPEQMVDADGRVTVPFVGPVMAAGHTPSQIARDITARLNGLAHKPQVVVRLTRNASKNVTVVGDVANSARVPLTAKGERLLDAIAAAGGVKQPVNKMTIQVTRGNRVVSEPLQSIIADPRQNILLQPDDVVTAYFQPYSFTALGATGANSEIQFESTGINLAQALGRAGGVNDQRANIRGVFLFRLEDGAALGASAPVDGRTTPDGKIPVIYRIDLSNPATFFVAQSFAIRNKDVLYISNAPTADLQKFVNIVSSVIIPAITVQNATRN